MLPITKAHIKDKKINKPSKTPSNLKINNNLSDNSLTLCCSFAYPERIDPPLVETDRLEKRANQKKL